MNALDSATACEDANDVCLREMFTRVGEQYPNPALTADPEWYRKRSWTAKDQRAFGKWMAGYIKKRFRWDKKRVQWEVGMFLLMWGWTTKEVDNTQ